MPVLCEEQVEVRIRKAFDYAFSSTPPAGGGVPQLTFERIGMSPFDVLGARVIPLRLHHGPFDVLGFRFGDVAYCTDTSGIPGPTWPLLEGLDVLILDCLRHTRHPTHFSLEESLAVAARTKAKRTILTHLSHELPHEATTAALPAGVELAYDGLEVPLR
jgi:phosphoribosyl 1,2-cyclic phosphate phosphodiesterase